MVLDVLRSELERLFELDQLKELAHRVLGVEPAQLDGATAKGSFVASLVERCQAAGAVEALCDAMAAAREGLDPRVADVRRNGYRPEDPADVGHSVGPYSLEEKLGEGSLSAVYIARKEAQRYRLKLIRSDIAATPSRVMRFLAVSRLVGGIDHPNLPRNLTADCIEGKMVVIHALREGQPLRARLESHQPKKLRNVWPLVRQVLEGLAAIHAHHFAHGDLRPENVLVVPVEDESEEVLLLDAGANHLRAPWPVAGGGERSVGFVGPNYAAPELIRGEPATPTSDVYAFGVFLYELLGGRLPFTGDDADVLAAHVGREPEPLSFVAPRGWIDSDLDEFVLGLLDKDSKRRPPDADAVLDVLETFAGRSVRRDSMFPEDEFNERVRVLLDNPADEVAAGVLEAAVDQGADARGVAEAMRLAAEDLPAGLGARAARKRLLTRSGGLYENVVRDAEAAIQTYRLLLELDAEDPGARVALERIYRREGKYDELVDLLVERAKTGEDPTERARAFAKLGHLFDTRLGDHDQALVAFTHAFCEDPSDAGVLREIERLAGARPEAWNDVLQSCGEAAGGDMPVERRIAVLMRMGRWYTEKLTRPDLALRCYQEVLAADPANDPALAELSVIYRKAQQWKELSRTLARRSNAAVTPVQARELRAEAAQILEERLGDPEGAAQLYELVVEDDPSHPRAGEALTRLYEKAEDFAGYVRILQLRADALIGERRQRLMCRLADACETRLGDAEQARRVLELVLIESPDNLDALRGLERMYVRAHDANGLLDNLQQQFRYAVTSEQKLQLLRRIAGLHEEEFHDRAEAAVAYERILEIEPGDLGTLQRLEHHYSVLGDLAKLADTLERHADELAADSERVAKLLELARVYANRLADTERALVACEAAIALDPKNRDALDLLAELRTAAGDDEQAVVAIDALADAASPQSRSWHLHRAALLLQKRGDLEGVIEHCNKALEANPDDQEAAFTLRGAYLERGDVQLAIGVLERSIARTASASVEARLCVELAGLLRDDLGEMGRAEAAAARAVERDPTNRAARLLLAEIAFDGGRFEEAAEQFGRVADYLDQLEPTARPRVVRQYLESLARAGSVDQALERADRFLADSPQDSQLQAQISEFYLRHGPVGRARRIAEDYVKRFASRLSEADRAAALYRLGEAARRAGHLAAATSPLEQAAKLNPEAMEALEALEQVYEKQEQWDKLSRVLQEQLERVPRDRRVDLLVKIGDLAESSLRAPEIAAKSYLTALDERPGDRRILMKLLHLYSEEKDWTKLMEVLHRLAAGAADSAQRAKYLLTAARVAIEELHDREQARHLLEQVEATGCSTPAAIDEVIELYGALDHPAGLKRILEAQIRVAAEAQDHARGLRLADRLADVHLAELEVDQAISVYEATQELDPFNPRRQEVLGELYASDPRRYLARAVRAQEQMLVQDPYRPEPYRLLHRVYGDVKNHDALWCVSQTLSVLHRASPDEEAFFKRYRRSDGVAIAQPVSEENWNRLILHPSIEPLVTAIFTLIQPAVVEARTTDLVEYGYEPSEALQLGQHPYGLVRAFERTALGLGMEVPLLFHDPDVVGLGMPHTEPRCLVLGPAGLSRDVSPARAAFVAATHLASFRPGFAVRYLVPTPVALKAWMLAALKLIAPSMPIASELERPVLDAHELLRERIKGALLDRLAQPVYRLLQSGAQVDVARWMAGVDHTSDRLGLLFSDDLRTALEVLEATGDAASVASARQRCRELLCYSVSTRYLALRARLGIAVAARDPEQEKLALESLLSIPPPAPSQRTSQPPPVPDRMRRRSMPPPPPVRSRPGGSAPDSPDRAPQVSKPPPPPVRSRPASPPPESQPDMASTEFLSDAETISAPPSEPPSAAGATAPSSEPLAEATARAETTQGSAKKKKKKKKRVKPATE